MRGSLLIVVLLLAASGCEPSASRQKNGWDVFLDPETVLFAGKPVAVIFDTLRRGTPRERADAARDLWYVYTGLDQPGMQTGLMGWQIADSEHCRQRAGVMLPHLIDAIDDPEASVRLAVVEAIRGMSFHAVTARRALETRLNDPAAAVQAAA